jgi:hypothetical protein
MTVIVLNLILQFIGALISIAWKLPYEFGGTGDPDNVTQDFLTGGGTALSAPLVPLLIVAVFLILAARRDEWGRLLLAASFCVHCCSSLPESRSRFCGERFSLHRSALMKS